MTEFYESSFHWNAKAILQVTDEEIKRAVEVLNKLTPEQVAAARLYARSQYEEGYAEGREAGESTNRYD